jgi:hypothetical protein
LTAALPACQRSFNLLSAILASFDHGRSAPTRWRNPARRSSLDHPKKAAAGGGAASIVYPAFMFRLHARMKEPQAIHMTVEANSAFLSARREGR